MTSYIYRTDVGYAALTVDDCPANPREMSDCLAHIHLYRDTRRGCRIIDVDGGGLYCPDAGDCNRTEFYAGLHNIGAVVWCGVSVECGRYETHYGVADGEAFRADGIAWATAEDLRRWGCDSPTREEFREDIAAELAEYEAWANGYVYGIQTFGRTGAPSGLYAETCWGFYGEDCAMRECGATWRGYIGRTEDDPGEYVAEHVQDDYMQRARDYSAARAE